MWYELVNIILKKSQPIPYSPVIMVKIYKKKKTLLSKFDFGAYVSCDLDVYCTAFGF